MARNSQSSQPRNNIGSLIFSAAILIFGVVAFFLNDQVGIRFGLFGSFIWIFIFAVVFTAGVAYHALFILPVDIESWYEEGLSLIWQQFFSGARSQRSEEKDGVPPSIETLGAGVIDSHVVLALGRGGTFSRAAGPGYIKLEPYEKILHVIDLRHHFRQRRIRARTRDGIPFEAQVSVTFRVRRRPPEEVSENEPYAYDKTAIFQVSYYSSIGEGEFEIPWTDRIIPLVADEFVTELSNYTLDEVYSRGLSESAASEEAIDEASSAAFKPELIKREVFQRVQQHIQEHGVEIVAVDIGRIVLPSNVKKQRIANWQAEWQRRAQIQQSKGDALALEKLEQARSQAEVELIRQIVDSIEAVQWSDNADLSDIINLVAIDAIEKAAADEHLKLQPQLLATLSQIQNLTHSGTPPSPSQPQLPAPKPQKDNNGNDENENENENGNEDEDGDYIGLVPR